MTFMCRDVGNEDEWTPYDEFDAEDAAEAHAEECLAYGDPCDEFEIEVQGHGVYTVSVEQVNTFHASKKKGT